MPLAISDSLLLLTPYVTLRTVTPNRPPDSVLVVLGEDAVNGEGAGELERRWVRANTCTHEEMQA